MDQLPSAIQNEIWEYVRGHRAYWKSQFGLAHRQIDGIAWTCGFQSEESLMHAAKNQDADDMLARGMSAQDWRIWLRKNDFPIYHSSVETFYQLVDAWHDYINHGLKLPSHTSSVA